MTFKKWLNIFGIDEIKHFYETYKIKEVDDISRANLNRSSTSFTSNIVSSLNKNINTATKFSIQYSMNSLYNTA